MGKAVSLKKKAVCFACAAGMLLSLLALFFFPPARSSALAVFNRLFAASEQVNAYVYERFPVPDSQSAVPAMGLAAVFLICFLGLCMALRSLGMLLIAAGSAALVQAYFGLSLPDYANPALFLLLGLLMVTFVSSKRAALPFAAAALVIAFLTAALWPGVDTAVERASETVRDRLAFSFVQEDSALGDDPDAAMETRHMNARSLLTGEEEAAKNREYRLLTVEEQQISQPRWIDYLKIVLLLLLSVLAVLLPFLPFLYFNRCRNKVREKRRLFQSENAAEALCAMFRHAAAYLENGGFGGGNLPYRKWPDTWQKALPEAYKKQYAACARLFEEAAYSGHPLSDEPREQMRMFLAETEKIFFDEADWKEKMRLRYGKCLHE